MIAVQTPTTEMLIMIDGVTPYRKERIEIEAEIFFIHLSSVPRYSSQLLTVVK